LLQLNWIKKNNLQPGIHRVIFSDKPRISMWYELNTIKQVPKMIQRNGLQVPKKITQMNLEKDKDYFHYSKIKHDKKNKKETFSISIKAEKRKLMGRKTLLTTSTEICTVIDNVNDDTTISEIIHEVTKVTGIPPSKSILTQEMYDVTTGHILERETTLKDCGIGNNGTLYMKWAYN